MTQSVGGTESPSPPYTIPGLGRVGRMYKQGGGIRELDLGGALGSGCGEPSMVF
jgi:hypothetical protein